MKIALLSDIHGNAAALRAVLADIGAEAAQILFLGDLVGYYPFAEECARLLSAREVIGVLGNHDQVFVDCFEAGTLPGADYEARYGRALSRSLSQDSAALASFLLRLPQGRLFEAQGLKLGMWHGAPWDALGARVYPDFTGWQRFDDRREDIILLGHTHYQMVRHRGDKLIVNPGSVGQSRDRRGEACYAMLDPTTREVTLRRVRYDSSGVIEDARSNEPQLSYLVEVLLR